MKHRSQASSAFSLVEVVLALGVAAFCFVAVLGLLPVGLKTQQGSVNQTKANAIISVIAADLRAQVRLPPGQASKQFALKGYWATAGTRDTLFFTNDGQSVGNVPAGGIFRASISYLLPPTATTSLANITVSWPAAQTDLTKVAGSVEMFVAINR